MSYWSPYTSRSLADMEHDFMIHACMDRAFAKQKAEDATKAAEVQKKLRLEFYLSKERAMTAAHEWVGYGDFADIQFLPSPPSVSTISLIMTTSAMLATAVLDMPAMIGLTTIIAASLILKK
jgi:hypothetical protein